MQAKAYIERLIRDQEVEMAGVGITDEVCSKLALGVCMKMWLYSVCILSCSIAEMFTFINAGYPL